MPWAARCACARASVPIQVGPAHRIAAGVDVALAEQDLEQVRLPARAATRRGHPARDVGREGYERAPVDLRNFAWL